MESWKEGEKRREENKRKGGKRPLKKSQGRLRRAFFIRDATSSSLHDRLDYRILFALAFDPRQFGFLTGSVLSRTTNTPPLVQVAEGDVGYCYFSDEDESKILTDYLTYTVMK